MAAITTGRRRGTVPRGPTTARLLHWPHSAVHAGESTGLWVVGGILLMAFAIWAVTVLIGWIT